jgi:predicted transcriptional regulator of viral defense system
MESLNFPSVIKKIYESNLFFFTTKTLRDIIKVTNENTFFKYIRRLVEEGILSKIERDKYIISKGKVSDFELANFLVYPSYVSFESALNFWGILSQFPYEVTSATSKKTKLKKYKEKVFSYTHIDKNLFFGYEKIDNFLIANQEKSLLDEIYLVSKGIKKINLEELDFTKLKKKILKDYLSYYPKTRQFLKVISKLPL